MMSESLSDKLRSLGVRIGTQNLPPPKPQPVGYPIESVVEGRMQDTDFGPVFLVEKNYQTDYYHGDILLSTQVNPQNMAAWAKTMRLNDTSLDKVLYLDTETSGLAGGTGTYAFLIGLGFRVKTGFVVQQVFMRDPSQESALLAALEEIIRPFETIVTFNGKSFDIPLLKTRLVMNNMASPFKELEHVDLLPLARRLWRNRLTSRALKDLETEILHVPRTQEEVPGWMIPDLYFEFLRSGDARPLAGIFYHNQMDILSLAALFNFCADLLHHPLHQKSTPGLDLAAVARLFEELDQIESAIEVYEESLKKGDLPLLFYLETLQRFAMLHRKNERWSEAEQLWLKAADHHWLDAYIELAKFYEHHERDYPEAMRWTQAGVHILNELGLPYWRKKALQDELNHRLERLQKKNSTQSTSPDIKD
jgi:uncharacterized protein